MAVDGGAKVLMGGKRLNRPGYFLEPTILTDITPENPAFHVEFFAPVALIFRVKNEKEAIDLANDSPYGLGGSVITQRCRAGKAHCPPDRDGNGLHQPGDLDRARPSVRRREELRLWP